MFQKNLKLKKKICKKRLILQKNKDKFGMEEKIKC